MQDGISMRMMTVEDGPAIAALSDQSADAGAVGFRNRYHYDAYATIMALHENACGVVAEAPDHPGIVGMGMMSLGECQYEGAVRPFAYLFSLTVHPAYRRRGIASRLAERRVQIAREKNGPGGVILAGIQQGNTGSQRTAARWRNQMIAGRALVPAVKMRSAPPPREKYAVRQAEPGDFEEIAARQNAFYAGFNFYPPRTAAEIAGWHAQQPFGESVRSYWVASDPQGRPVAGASVTEEGKCVTIEIQRMSLLFRAANRLVKLFPPDRRFKRLHVKDLWFAPGHEQAGAYLWEHLRWELRERGSLMMTFIDRQSPLAGIIRLPWYLPKPGGWLVLSAPMPASEARPLYFMM